MAGGGEILDWIVWIGVTIGAIAFLDYKTRNLPEALGDDFSADSYTAALRNALSEKKATVHIAGGKCDGGQRPSGNVAKQTNSQSNNSHSTSPANFAGRVGL